MIKKQKFPKRPGLGFPLLPTMPPTNWPRSATPHAPPILPVPAEPSALVVVAGR